MPALPFIALAVLLFVAGVFVLLTRRSAAMALFGIELMLNAANINLVVFGRWWGQQPAAGANAEAQAHWLALMLMLVAAAEAAVALALVVLVYRRWRSTQLDALDNVSS